MNASFLLIKNKIVFKTISILMVLVFLWTGVVDPAVRDNCMFRETQLRPIMTFSEKDFKTAYPEKTNIRGFIERPVVFLMMLGLISLGSLIYFYRAPKEFREQFITLQTPNTVTVSSDSSMRNRMAQKEEVKYYQMLQLNRTNLLSQEETAQGRRFLKGVRYKVITYSARKFDLEPELLSAFLFEEELYGLTKHKIKRLIEEDLVLRLSMESLYQGTIGLGQISTKYIVNKKWLDHLYENRMYFLSILKSSELASFQEFISFYTEFYRSEDAFYTAVMAHIESKQMLLIDLAKIEEINIFLTGFVIRELADTIAKTNTGVTVIPDMSVMKGHSKGWLVSAYKEIPEGSAIDDVDLMERYSEPFGGIPYYHGLTRYYAVARRYGGNGSNYSRALGKVNAYSLFLRSGFFKKDESIGIEGKNLHGLSLRNDISSCLIRPMMRFGSPELVFDFDTFYKQRYLEIGLGGERYLFTMRRTHPPYEWVIIDTFLITGEDKPQLRSVGYCDIKMNSSHFAQMFISIEAEQRELLPNKAILSTLTFSKDLKEYLKKGGFDDNGITKMADLKNRPLNTFAVAVDHEFRKKYIGKLLFATALNIAIKEKRDQFVILDVAPSMKDFYLDFIRPERREDVIQKRTDDKDKYNIRFAIPSDLNLAAIGKSERFQIVSNGDEIKFIIFAEPPDCVKVDMWRHRGDNYPNEVSSNAAAIFNSIGWEDEWRKGERVLNLGSGANPAIWHQIINIDKLPLGKERVRFLQMDYLDPTFVSRVQETLHKGIELDGEIINDEKIKGVLLYNVWTYVSLIYTDTRFETIAIRIEKQKENFRKHFVKIWENIVPAGGDFVFVDYMPPEGRDNLEESQDIVFLVERIIKNSVRGAIQKITLIEDKDSGYIIGLAIRKKAKVGTREIFRNRPTEPCL